MKLSTLKVRLPVVQRLVVYGPPKSGKTQLVSQLAEHFNLKWFDFENGMSPLLKLPIDWQERIDIAKIPDCKDLPIGIETALKIVSGAPGAICGLHGKWNCLTCKKDPKQAEVITPVHLNALTARDIVVFDSLTQIATSAMNWIMRGAPEESKPERDQWGQLKFVMEKFLTNIQQARYNLICITHEDEVEMVDGREKLVPVSGSRNTSRNTAKYFDHVVYCNVANRKHSFGSATTYATSVMSGSRLDINIESLGTPSLLPFFQHLLDLPAGTPLTADPQAIVSTVPAPDVSPETLVLVDHAVAVMMGDDPVAPATSTEILKPESTGSAALARLQAMRAKKGR